MFVSGIYKVHGGYIGLMAIFSLVKIRYFDIFTGFRPIICPELLLKITIYPVPIPKFTAEAVWDAVLTGATYQFGLV